MEKINVYVTTNNVLTLATNQITEKYVNGEIIKEEAPTKLVGYMEAALVEEVDEADKN